MYPTRAALLNEKETHNLVSPPRAALPPKKKISILNLLKSAD
jgi:hypothetical protein